ncbi:hypothetical protein [Bremerella sp. P1]|uniref:hypothetical protein n=1 Tax=Bremerella sp. P1 TaxID=3026424 RepID=UPI0023684DAC|nr:hypothetical protein [Bremerella sp. P1]WDI44406.1 hypothetical protein PSR63_10725 [Bremerella sp. P1]
MSDTVAIRFSFDGSLEEAQKRLGQLFHVAIQKGTAWDGDDVYFFSSMGMGVSLFKHKFHDPDHDPRLSDNDVIVQMNLYAPVTGRMYFQVAVLSECASPLAGMIATDLHCVAYVCSEDDVVLEEVMPDSQLPKRKVVSTTIQPGGDEALSRIVRIRFDFDGDLEQARETLGRLFNVEMEKHVSPILDESFSFAAMGVKGTVSKSFYFDPDLDSRLSHKDVMIDVTLYAPVTNRTASKTDRVLDISSILASMVAVCFDRPVYVCSSHNEVIEEVIPTDFDSE